MKKITKVFFVVHLFFLSACAQAPKKVIIEDFTGIWCGWCPAGKTAAEHCEATFGDKVICMGVHVTDALSKGYPDDIANGITAPGYLIGSIDRFNDDPSGNGILTEFIFTD